VLSLFSERITRENRLILEEKKWLLIPDTKGSESINHIEIRERPISLQVEDTLDLQSPLREVMLVMSRTKGMMKTLTQKWYLLRLDRETGCLSMSPVSHEEISARIKQLDDITPLGTPTGCDGESRSMTFSILSRTSSILTLSFFEWKALKDF
jgi:hypothetical protein